MSMSTATGAGDAAALQQVLSRLQQLESIVQSQSQGLPRSPPPPPPKARTSSPEEPKQVASYHLLLERNTALVKQISVLQQENDRLRAEFQSGAISHDHKTTIQAGHAGDSTVFNLPLSVQKRDIRVAPGVHNTH